MSELKPYAYAVTRLGCRAPDDCEEYDEIIIAKEFEREFNHQEYLAKGLAIPLYDIPEGYALVPVEPGSWMFLRTPSQGKKLNAYAHHREMIKAAKGNKS